MPDDTTPCPILPGTPCPSRRAVDPHLTAIRERVASLEDGQLDLSVRLEANTVLTKDVQKNTAAIVEAWSALSGGLKVLGVLGTIGRYVAYIAAAVSAIAGAWTVITHWGDIPKGPPK